MPRFSPISKRRLATCDSRLQNILKTAIKIVDFHVVCGHRDMADQEKAFMEGFSKLQWPHSRHNKMPSEAVDVAPWINGEIAWERRDKFAELAGVIKAIAYMQGVRIKWGGDFKTFKDLPHFQVED